VSLTVANLIDKLRRHTGEDSTDLPDDDATLLLNQSYWELLDKFPFREKEQASTFSYVDGTRLYAAPSPFEAVQHIVVYDTDDNKHTRLKRMSLKWYEDEYDSDDEAEGKPEYYARYGSNYYVYPTPDEAYGGVIYYWTTLDDLSDSQNPEPPQVWHEIIMYGAVWRRFLENADYIRAREIKNHQVMLINSTSPVEAKEEGDSRFAGIELPPELTEV
jgi:hypothetical protein